jgi:glycosyltransferase involved in cell wall biosynthesis
MPRSIDMPRPIRILLTGQDAFTYNRTQVLLAGLKEIGVELIYMPIKSRRTFDKTEFEQLSKTVDYVYIPPFRHSDVKYIKRMSHAPVVFDALISKYLTRTIDHGKWWTAWEKKWRDKVAFKHSDVIIMDTEAHKRYIVDLYKLNPDKVIVVPVGVDTALFQPRPHETGDVFKVGFYGGFIPLQGVDKIVKAAHLLKDEPTIRFEVIGKGPDYKKVMKLVSSLNVKNIDFLGWVPYDELNAHINSYDLCLGIFGDSLKADLVVPNKIFHYAALKKCIISKDTLGLREIFVNEENIILTQNDPNSIAECILKYKQNGKRLKEVAINAFELITRDFNQEKIAHHFIEQVRRTLPIDLP